MKSSLSFLTRSSKKRITLSLEPASAAIGVAAGTTGALVSDEEEEPPPQALEARTINSSTIVKPSCLFRMSIESILAERKRLPNDHTFQLSETVPHGLLPDGAFKVSFSTNHRAGSKGNRYLK
jgi:hypothetical protein